MKKILSMLGSLSLLISPTATIIACGGTAITDPVIEQLELSSAIPKTDLGTFKTQPTNHQILDQTKALNPNLEVSQVQVTANADGQATITVNTNATIYSQGSVTMTYKVDEAVKLPALGNIIDMTDLGPFLTKPTSEEILNKLKELNPIIDTTQLEVIANADGQVTVRVVTNSPIYGEGSVTLIYEIFQPLDEVIIITDLGQFETKPTNQEILDQVKFLNQKLDLSQVQLTANDNNQATISVIPDSKIYEQGSVDLTYIVVPKLDSVITITDLGIFITQPTDQEVLDKLVKLNPCLDISQLQITANVNRKATVTVIADSKVYYQGSIDLTYILAEDLPTLASVITNPDLGEFTDQPSGKDILDKLASLYPSLDMSQIQITTNANNQATLRVINESKVYAPGSIILNYTVHKLIDLSSVIQNIELGEFVEQPTDEILLAKVKELNAELELSEIHILTNVNDQAIIAVNSGSTVYKQGSVTVTYTVHKTILQSITDIIGTTILGLISSNSPDVILTQVKVLNPDLILSEVEVVNISNSQATIKVKKGSTIYASGSILVTFLIKILPSITRDLTISDLGKIGTVSGNVSDEDILARVAHFNPNLIMSEVHVTLHSGNQATIVVNLDSRVYSSLGSVIVTFTPNRLVDLSTVIKTTDLGRFDHAPTAQEILNTLAAKNKNLDISQVQVSENADGKATVIVISDSQIYSHGSINLTYEVYILRNIDSDLTTQILGIFNWKPTHDEALARLIQKNPKLITSEFTIALNSLLNYINLIVNPDSKIYKQQGNMQFFYEIVKLPKLISKLTNTVLGTFNSPPNSEDILNRVKDLNTEIDIIQLQVTANGDGKAIVGVIPNSEVYDWKIDYLINLTYIVLRDIKTDLKVTDLGQFATQPTIADIITRLKDLNPTLVLTEFDVQISLENWNGVLIGHKNSLIYIPVMSTITYKIAVPELKKDLITTNLGSFEDNATEEQILARIHELNPTVNLTQINLTNVSETQAKVNVIKDSHVYAQGSMIVTFTIHRLIDAKDLVTNYDLGIFDFIPSNEAYIKRVGSLNPNLLMEEFKYFSTTAQEALTIAVIPNSTVYKQGTLTFKMRWAVPVESRITTKNLGWFSIKPDVQMIFQVLRKLNPSLAIYQLNVTEIKDMSAIISVNENSNYYAPGSFEVIFTYPIDLSDHLKVTDIGEILLATPNAILNALKNKTENSNLNINELNVTNISSSLLERTATINVNANSNVYKPGSIDIKFRLLYN